MKKRTIWLLAGGLIILCAIAVILLYTDLSAQLEWRIDAAYSSFRCMVKDCDTLPTPNVDIGEIVVPTPRPVSTLPADPTQTPTPVPLPDQVSLPAPVWEKQDWNNCGPATLAIALRFYGWDGDQFDISAILKPNRGDRNVNIEELIFYVRTRAGWLDGEYRVAGTIETLRRFLAAGYPIIVEKGYEIESDGPDGGWAGHYLLLTGYDDDTSEFITQDSFLGPDQRISYDELEAGWQAFNDVYLVLYPVSEHENVLALMGEDADEDRNRETGIETAQRVLQMNPDNAYAWFNLGSNLLYFERYEEAAQAYDTALTLGLPWRFLRYQFGPYITYFNVGRYQDIYDLADATLALTSNAEESLLWRGWAQYRLGDTVGAIEDFRAALNVNPGYQDAIYALEFLGASP